MSLIQKIFHSVLIGVILFYSAYLFFSGSPCERVYRSGSVIRVSAQGLFFLTDNWMTASDRVSVRHVASDFDNWFQGIVKVTFMGRDAQCNRPAVAPVSISPANEVKPTDAQTKIVIPAQKQLPATIKQTSDRTHPEEETNLNPYNLPPLPEIKGKAQ